MEAQAFAAQKNFSDGEILSKAFENFAGKSKALTAAQKLLAEISDELSAAQIEFDKRTAEESRRKELERLATELAQKKSALVKLQAKRKERDKADNAAADSAKKVSELEDLKRRCDDTMARYTAEVERLQDAPAKLAVAAQNLKEAQAREKLLQNIAGLRKEISTAEKILSTATKNHDAAEKNLAELRRAQADGSAARLAAELVDGEPCPVCGAIHHPKPATSDASIPTDAQIKSAESRLKTLVGQKNSAAENFARLTGQLNNFEKNLSEGAQVVTVAEAQTAVDKISADVATLNQLRVRIQNGDKKIRETVAALEKAQSADKKFSDAANTLRGEVAAMKRMVDAKYLSDEKLLDDKISSVT
ncbi:MAG: hypothetical protein J5497_01750, partial [Selenomonadaceae bacterium]|nr:hypothetical protein [Selenomonadaceae bacterium]